ncbi:MAG: CRISPR-associated protein Csx19 [Potamolinea sp.]
MNKPICNSLSVEDVANDTPKLWLDKQAKEHGLKFLLAHAEDGVIWGHFKDGKLVTSGDVFSQCAKLRSSTLQQCRIFGEKAEVMLWKVGQNWKARLIEDENLSKDDYIPEDQILWGTKPEVELKEKGFILVSDGSQGLKHAVPLTGITFKGKDSRPLRLKVRHYIDYDESGVARIYLSRLVKLDCNGKA